MLDPLGPSVISLEDVRKTHGGGNVAVEALRGINLDVYEGEYVAIMGPSGSGKTTLLAIIGCLDRPSSGSYQLAGEEMTKLDETHRARVRAGKIGFVFQAYNLIPRSSAYRNVELPLIYARVPARERRERVENALRSVGLSDRARHVPSQLSGGEQQRVAIARALVIRPKVLLADEPTGNLDSASAEDVLGTIQRINRLGTTVVMVTHSSDVAAHASRIVRFSDGRIVADERVFERVEVA